MEDPSLTLGALSGEAFPLAEGVAFPNPGRKAMLHTGHHEEPHE